MRREQIQLRGPFLLRGGTEPLFVQIARRFEVAIRRGWLRRGARLPSTRALAAALGVSRNTVITAFDELTARGLIRARRGGRIQVSAAVRTLSVTDPDGNPISVVS